MKRKKRSSGFYLDLAETLWLGDDPPAPEGWSRWTDLEKAQFLDWQERRGYEWACKRAAQGEPTAEPLRKAIPARTRFEVLSAAGYRCFYCGRSVQEDGIRLTVDHIQPVSKGGTNDRANLRAACFDCNIGKGAMLLDGDN